MRFTHAKLEEQLKLRTGKLLSEANQRDVYEAVASLIMLDLMGPWADTRRMYHDENRKQMFYFSAEFLMGRAFSNNLINLQVDEEVRALIRSLGLDFNLLEEQETDAGLGNGGLGRLAACFLDSLATLGLPGHGYGILYRYGMFAQQIQNGYQVEAPDAWLRFDHPWIIRHMDASVVVKFGGRVEAYTDEDGKAHFSRHDTEDVLAVPYDMPIVGYGGQTINTLRLWEAHGVEDFDLTLFNRGEYLRAVEKANISEDISRVLYPNDNTVQGRILRLRQQYFFTSASLQDLMSKHKARHGTDFASFAEQVAIQLNDTHPVLAIPELMRLLMDEEAQAWVDAWDICTRVFGYTNHTVLAEALEKWEVSIFQSLLPRIYQIVEEINRIFVESLRLRFPKDGELVARMSIIQSGMIHMAHLAIVGSHSVNGVAALHTEILKQDVLKDWYALVPERFNNKTNGVTQRRWLLKSNPRQAQLISEAIGAEWITHLDHLKQLAPLADDAAFLQKYQEAKHANKVDLSNYVRQNLGVSIDPTAIFDVQIKRLHEYKRQLLNVLHIIHLYNRLRENPNQDMVPRVFLFGAKAASAYTRAKLIIKLINNVARVIANDPAVSQKLSVLFLPNYNVSLAERIFPASDVSEQISTAGKEASGTGNMKFMLNGALTLGTMDGANIEIVEEVGAENAYIFGARADEINALRKPGAYNPQQILSQDAELARILAQLVDGSFTPTESQNLFQTLHDSLVYGVDGNPADQYFLLQDFRPYTEAHDKVNSDYQDKTLWAQKSLRNVAASGKFSSDRTIMEYAKDIWNIHSICK